MSYTTWHNYGNGICTDDIQEHSVTRLQELLELAPQFHAEVQSWLLEQDITAPTWEDYMDYDSDDYDLGLATIIKEVIEEAEGFDLTACDDCNGKGYVLYQAKYPWQITDTDKPLTEKKLTDIFNHYVSILTDEAIPVEDQSVENGG